MKFSVITASEEHTKYAVEICEMMQSAAQKRGTGIAKRDPEYIKGKMCEGKAIIAIETETGVLAGFCYIETWSHTKYVANSGLIVNELFRNQGLAKKIKETAFNLSRQKYPEAKLFGLTTGLAVMKINSDLGYRPVTFSELTDDEKFWTGCQSCVNFDVLTRTDKKHCLCTGMLFDPVVEKKRLEAKEQKPKLKLRVYERWMRIKAETLLRFRKKENKDGEVQNKAKVLV